MTKAEEIKQLTQLDQTKRSDL